MVDMHARIVFTASGKEQVCGGWQVVACVSKRHWPEFSCARLNFRRNDEGSRTCGNVHFRREGAETSNYLNFRINGAN